MGTKSKPSIEQNNQKKQQLKSDQLILTGILLAVLVVSSLTIVSRAWTGRQKDIAKVESEKIATRYIAVSELREHRGPASASTEAFEGVTTRDPWGRAYNRRWIHTKDKSASYLVVWSYGPNKRNDSDLDWLESEASQNKIFSGDDIGVVVSLRGKTGE